MAKKKEEKKEEASVEEVSFDVVEEKEEKEVPKEKQDLYTLSKPDTMFYDGRFVITSEDKIPLPDVITGPIQARLDSGFIVKVEE
ncbi:hypothetical protein ACQUEF_01695 [Vagococcus fluvialis]|uniref:hypothetical protein n=1 Tax=Vagococcus fluvialis TaxID=2738 RepID=UPI003B215A0D